MRRAAAFVVLALAATPVLSADVGGQPPAGADVAMPSSPGLPSCDNPSVLGNIVERQHWAEANTWQDGVRIEAIVDIRQAYARTKFTSAIEHRHCVARADLGAHRGDTLYYVISREMGFAGISWYVDFCMPRHDPYRVYDADCRVLR